MIRFLLSSRYLRLRHHVLRSIRSILCRAAAVGFLSVLLVLPVVYLMGGVR